MSGSVFSGVVSMQLSLKPMRIYTPCHIPLESLVEKCSSSNCMYPSASCVRLHYDCWALDLKVASCVFSRDLSFVINTIILKGNTFITLSVPVPLQRNLCMKRWLICAHPSLSPQHKLFSLWPHHSPAGPQWFLQSTLSLFWEIVFTAERFVCWDQHHRLMIRRSQIWQGIGFVGRSDVLLNLVFIPQQLDDCIPKPSYSVIWAALKLLLNNIYSLVQFALFSERTDGTWKLEPWRKASSALMGFNPL